MQARLRWEAGAFVLLVLVLLGSLIPSLLYARRERRDGIRRDELLAAKTSLEQYYNIHEAYPLQFEADPHQYIVEQSDTKGATHWYLRAELENAHPEEHGFDQEHNVLYRYATENNRMFFDICGGESRCDATQQ